MEITLTVSSGDVIPESLLRAFANRARQKGMDASVLLATLIEKEVGQSSSRSSSTRSKRKGVGRA